MPTSPDAKEEFVPTFAMPVIAPPPKDYASDAPTYYAEVASQTTVTTTPVEILPEQVLPTTLLEKKGLLITITNPNATFQPSTTPPPLEFGTLFALMGGQLTYRPATSPLGLNSLLLPPFSDIPTPLQYPAPEGLVTAAWGTLVLTLWGTDFDKLQTTLCDHPACLAVYYVGVDQASLVPLLKPALKQLFTEKRYQDHLAAQNQLPPAQQKKPVFREVVEAITLLPYSTPPAAPTPTYEQLIDAHLTAFVNGTTSLTVKGGTPIGKAIQCTIGGPTAGQVELWFLDAGSPPQFISPVWIINGAPTYDF